MRFFRFNVTEISLKPTVSVAEIKKLPFTVGIVKTSPSSESVGFEKYGSLLPVRSSKSTSSLKIETFLRYPFSSTKSLKETGEENS